MKSFKKFSIKPTKIGKQPIFLKNQKILKKELNIFVGSNNQKSLPRKTKILNKSVTNFEVKMQMAKGCEK